MYQLKKVYLEITNVCNLRCDFCPGTRRPQGFLSPEDFSVLAQKLRPHTEYLYLHLMGEPLLHPQLPKLLDIAAGLGFQVNLTTNGTLLPQRASLLCQSPAVRKRCALRLWNLDGETTQGANSCNDVILRRLEETFPRPWKEGWQGTTLAPRVYLEWGERFEWPDLNADDQGQSGFCQGLRDHVGVLWDGTVVPCCLDHEGDIPLGNLYDGSLEDILSSPRARAIYNGFSQGRAAEELCRRCGYRRRFSK